MRTSRWKPQQFRLPYFNYASSAQYFVTITTKPRYPVFGSVIDGEVSLSELGQIVAKCLQELPQKYSFVSLDEWVVMPDHLHCILCLDNPNEERTIPQPVFGIRSNSLSFVIRNFKASVTLLARRAGITHAVWHPRFHDHIIRNEGELQRIRTYIRNNPKQWEADHRVSPSKKNRSS